MSLYETLLDRAASTGTTLPKTRPPRASAAVVPWRREEGRIQVYWVRRSMKVSFMPGWHAFPGGALSRTDPGITVEGRVGDLPGTADVSPIPAGLALNGESFGPDIVPGLVAASLRELFEETGLLLTTERSDLAALPALRNRLLDGEDFAELLAEGGHHLDASRLRFAGRWLTPPFASLRFDNRFFLLEWPREERQQPQIVLGELTEGEWIHPVEALERWNRSEVLAAPPILHLLRVLAEDGPEEGRSRLLDASEADIGPLRRVEFRPGVILIPLATATLPPATHTNAYLVGTGECVLIDPGSTRPDENERLIAALIAAAKQGRQVREIWLTHHHPDHVGGASQVARALDIPVRAHPLTAARLRTLPIEVKGDLHEGDRIELAGDPTTVLTVHHTPGHASGHLAFLVERHRSLISGDLLSAISTMVIDPPDGHMGTYFASLERVRDEIAPETLFPSHGPVLYPAGRALDRFLRHRRKREKLILDAYEAGRRSPADLVTAAYEGERLPAFVLPLAERQVEAHLEHLREQDKLSEPG